MPFKRAFRLFKIKNRPAFSPVLEPTWEGIDPARFKIIRMEGVQIRALIGKGGETIKARKDGIDGTGGLATKSCCGWSWNEKLGIIGEVDWIAGNREVEDIRFRSGADIKIDHLPSDRLRGGGAGGSCHGDHLAHLLTRTCSAEGEVDGNSNFFVQSYFRLAGNGNLLQTWIHPQLTGFEVLIVRCDRYVNLASKAINKRTFPHLPTRILRAMSPSWEMWRSEGSQIVDCNHLQGVFCSSWRCLLSR